MRTNRHSISICCWFRLKNRNEEKKRTFSLAFNVSLKLFSTKFLQDNNKKNCTCNMNPILSETFIADANEKCWNICGQSNGFNFFSCNFVQINVLYPTRVNRNRALLFFYRLFMNFPNILYGLKLQIVLERLSLRGWI